MKALWANPEKSVGNLFDETTNHIIVVEQGHPMWEGFLSYGVNIQDYVVEESAPITE